MSWILEQERILQIQQNYSREPMENIVCCFLYVNENNSLEKITYDTLPLQSYLNKENEKLGHILPKELVLQLIQNKRIYTPTSKYIFKNSWLYLVDLEPENIQDYSKNENFHQLSSGFMRVFHTIQDFYIPSSIFIFHSLNMLYFLFEEVSVKHSPKPILKIGLSSNHSSSSLSNEKSSMDKKKKRVTIKLQTDIEQEHKSKPKQTRKCY
jgi:hypothetical protein